MAKNFKFKEIELQTAVQSLLSDPAVVRSSISGKRLQILSPGRLNTSEGPDFSRMAILLNGQVIVGEGEFHLKASDWKQHKHHSDKKYAQVILHIVLDYDDTEAFAGETLHLDENLVYNEYNTFINPDYKPVDLDSIEDLQYYALHRLLRKSSEAQKILNTTNLENAFSEMVRSFLEKFNSRRKRPVYLSREIFTLMKEINNSVQFKLLENISIGIKKNYQLDLEELLKQKIASERPHLRRELVMNCTLPLAVCLADEQSRIDLFSWYWSAAAKQKYGVLTRQFKDIPQTYIWQQQGLLEYMQLIGKRANIIAEDFEYYAFAEVLSFYQLAQNTEQNIPEDFDSVPIEDEE
ncbi:MAG: hypothetical protein HW421_1756 [Ignavibacteria bacterium]|nr:hypothetical protein [Ignavibacteria bacterium]